MPSVNGRDERVQMPGTCDINDNDDGDDCHRQNGIFCLMLRRRCDILNWHMRWCGSPHWQTYTFSTKLKLQRNSRFFFRELFRSSVSLLLYSYRRCFAAIQSEELWHRLSFTRRHRRRKQKNRLRYGRRHIMTRTKLRRTSNRLVNGIELLPFVGIVHAAHTHARRRRHCVSTIASF